MTTHDNNNACCAQDVKPERVQAGRTYVPFVDIVETPEELLLLADMPGVSSEGVDVRYERGELTIRGTVKPRQEAGTRYLRREYGVGDFHRAFTIGEGIDAEKIEAELKDGVLTLHLPKVRALRPRKIAVKPT
ncbi:MAG: Spore protein SP21 [Phycisphaerae bacterium]|nr:Spore protein SP21 [Phycisphaerae bacterium]